MPAGCEFICKNSSCQEFNKGFVITGPWPIARIEMIITSNSCKQKDKFRDELIELKNQGRKYACIIYPNYGEITAIGWRINMWSTEAKCIWNYDILFSEEKGLEQLIEEQVPKTCPKTGKTLLSFNEIVSEGIMCPSCNIKLMQNRWFTNED